MTFYHRLGSIPPKRHIQFRKPDGTLYKEELMGLRGFSGIQSILYHFWEPTRVKSSTPLSTPARSFLTDVPLEHHHLVTTNFKSTGDPITSRVWLAGNSQVALALSTPTETMHYHYRNGQCDEILFVHEGTGTLISQFGDLPFHQGDYIVVPTGTTWRLELTSPGRFLIIEAHSQVTFPRRYMNEYGQLLEHAPFCERDIRVPQTLQSHDQMGDFEVRVKMGEKMISLIHDHHPIDVVGWDGFLYPWIFNINDFEPIVGSIHQPPPVHQTFAADGFSLCSFVSRKFDFHPQAIPVPYNHTNVNSDEFFYYVEGEFMSRRGIKEGSVTLHPAGLHHGPHPGTIEKSLGKDSCKELAVMVDTFAPLFLTPEGFALRDPKYMQSWLP